MPRSRGAIPAITSSRCSPRVRLLPNSISNTAEYGDYTSGPKVVTEDAKKAMKEVLDRIQSGEFAEEFVADARQSNSGAGGPVMESHRKESREHPIEKVGAELRGMMPWIEANKLVDKSKN